MSYPKIKKIDTMKSEPLSKHDYKEAISDFEQPGEKQHPMNKSISDEEIDEE